MELIQAVFEQSLDDPVLSTLVAWHRWQSRTSGISLASRKTMSRGRGRRSAPRRRRLPIRRPAYESDETMPGHAAASPGPVGQLGLSDAGREGRHARAVRIDDEQAPVKKHDVLAVRRPRRGFRALVR